MPVSGCHWPALRFAGYILTYPSQFENQELNRALVCLNFIEVVFLSAG